MAEWQTCYPFPQRHSAAVFPDATVPPDQSRQGHVEVQRYCAPGDFAPGSV